MKTVIQAGVVKWRVEAAVINDSDWCCSWVFPYWVVRDIVSIVWKLCIVNSLNETVCFLFSYNGPVSSRELGCGGKATNHRPGAPFTLDVVYWEQRGVFLPREFCIVTAILISCDWGVDVVFQENFMILPLWLWGDAQSIQGRPRKVQALDSGLFTGILYMFLWSVFFNVVKDRKQNSYNMTTAT